MDQIRESCSRGTQTRAWVEVSLDRLSQNVRAIRNRIGPNTEIIAVVKADAYGHGASTMVRHLWSSGVREFAVATCGEGAKIRERLGAARILVLLGCQPGDEELFKKHRLVASVFDEGSVPRDVPYEVKIDTGMARLGVPWDQAARFLASTKGQLLGVYSHFASSEDDEEMTSLQLERFAQATRGVNVRRHISNSGGLRFPEAHLDAVRTGLALYGVSPCSSITDLAPLLEWKTRVLSVRPIPAGTRVGYGGAYTASRDSLVAVLPVGYADGYSRAFSNRGVVRVRGRLAPVVGRVSMDLTTVDVTDIPGVVSGDEAVLLEADPSSPISATALADMIGTIPYEVLTSIGPRVERVYKGE